MSSERKLLLKPLFASQVNASWSWERLDSIADVFDCPHSTPVLVDEPSAPFVVRSQDVRTGTITLKDVAKVSEATYQERVKRVTPSFGDLVYSREGTYFGIAAAVPKGIKLCLGQRMVLIRPDRKRINHTYLKYWLNSPQVFGHIHGFRDGTVAERLNLPVIRGLAIGFPHLSVQTAIADTLSALDDRITLLRETNATLEAIAQAVFKSWFVDFDPVHAKQEGRAPEGMDEVTAALFPDGFEESELGLVPKGWRTGTLASLARLHKGSVNPGAQPSAAFQHFSLPAFDAGQMPVFELGSAIKSNKTTVPADGVLLSKLNPHIPRVWLPSYVDENAVCSTEFLPFVPSGPSTTAFVYCLMAASDFSASLCQLVTGTSNSHQRVKPDGVLSLPNVVPTCEVVTAFDGVANTLLSRLKANREQVQTLATLRDTLLPRLISGQLRLPEAEKQVDEVLV